MGAAAEHALPVGQHSELLHEFVHDSALWLQLRYRADEAQHAAVAATVAASASITEPRAGSGTGAAGAAIPSPAASPATAAVGSARARSSSVRFAPGEPGRSAPEGPAPAAAAVAAAAAAAAAAAEVDVPWGRREPLRIAEFEAVRQASLDDMQARAGLKQARDYVRFD